MVKPEERDQLITTYCATFKGIADNIVQRCDILLASDNNLFNDEQKTYIGSIQNPAQKFLSRVELARQGAVAPGGTSKESQRFEEFMACLINELRTPLSIVVGYAELFLEGEFGPLNNAQQEAIQSIYKLVQSLLPTITEFLISSRQE